LKYFHLNTLAINYIPVKPKHIFALLHYVLAISDIAAHINAFYDAEDNI